jgi:signal peptidase I
MGKKIILKRYNHRKREWLHDVLTFFVSAAVLFFVFRFVVGLAVVSGDSMYPTLTDGEALVYLRTVSDYKRGDIISIRVPSGDYYVKRVVAVAGDVVDIRDGEVYVNDELLKTIYGTGETLKQDGAVFYPYTVREGNVFVLGDNRSVSVDSRSFGEVNKIQIRGKIIFCFDF